MTAADDLIIAHRQVEEAQQKKQEWIETVAAVQHEIWSHWMKYLFSQCPKLGVGVTFTRYIPAVKVARWRRQMNTPYAELSEEEKNSDRDQAKKVMDALK